MIELGSYTPDIPQSITIVGCGNLGSTLAYMIMLRGLNKDTNLRSLYLIDDDILEPKNLPYLFNQCEQYLFKPKVNALENILSISRDLEIKTYNCSYPDFYNVPGEERVKINNTSIIDCRDTPSEVSTSWLKLNIDGKYGFINRCPKDIEKNRTSRYTMENSKYYAMFFACICCQMIFGDVVLEYEKIIVDLNSGEKHGITE